MPAHMSHGNSAYPMGAPAGSAQGLVRFGTRGSALALAQTDHVVAALRHVHPEIAAETTIIRTDGDVDKSSPLTVIGGRGVFTSALEEAIRRGVVDAAVHSAKDLPSDCPADLQLIAFFNRQDPRDVLVSRHGVSLMELPDRPVIGTSSRRRAAQVLAMRPDARIVELRGNVDTRLRKAAECDLDGIVLAAAGVTRMGWQDRIVEYLPLERFIPSPGQGALAIETRANPKPPVQSLADLDERAVSLPVRVERAFLRGIGGGCSTPVGAHAEWTGESLLLRCMLAREDGTNAIWARETLRPDEAEVLAATLAREMLAEVGQQRSAAQLPVNGRPLAGLSVLVTRPGTSATSFESDLVAAGASPVSAPTIRITPPADTAPIDRAIDEIGFGAYDWVVFTSGNAVDGVLRRIDSTGRSPVIFKATRVAAVGSATERRLANAGVAVDLVPARFDGEAVRDALIEAGVSGKRILLPRGNLAREVLAEGLRGAGAAVDLVEVYRTEPVTSIDPAIVAAIETGEFDVATFASSSCVRALASLLPNGLSSLLVSAVACLGPVTAETARDYGLRVDIVAEDATMAGLVQALIDKRDRIDAVRGQRSQPLIGAHGRTDSMTANGHREPTNHHPSFRRMRRLRRSEGVRRLVRETVLAPADFIYPLFVTFGVGVRRPIESMPGQFQLSVDQLPAELDELSDLGIGAVLLFGIPAEKDPEATGGYDPQGPVQEGVRVIKRHSPSIVVITDVCGCEYTDHGHCGIVVGDEVDNDRTLTLLARIALSHAEAGADVVAPSDMMDGRVAVIRAALDRAGFTNLPIMSYAAKYASGFYGPFREAAASMPAFGDRRSHQMDPGNAREAMAEIAIDIEEGADMIIIKPALPYLDIVRRARDAYDLPIVAYNVSGEYAMVKAASQLGWIDEARVAVEILTSIKRAGADRIISYHAKEVSRLLRDAARPEAAALGLPR